MDSPRSSHPPQSPAGSQEARVDGHTRTPSLLPAFEPLSSSPFPRPQSAKRKFNEDSPSFPKQQLKYYPTPVPTSSTGILQSSSPQHAAVRPALSRSISTLSQRAALEEVPTVDLPANGEVVRMGRSSNSSDYQLSANRLISRVHVQASYHAPSASCPHGRVEVECLGWNGAKIHVGGRVFELSKGETYESVNPGAEIMLDVQDTRVMIAWPATVSGRKISWESEGETTPTRRTSAGHFASSPPIASRSPVSQSPVRRLDFGVPTAAVAPSPRPVQVFEDADANETNVRSSTPTQADHDATFIRPALPASQESKRAKESMASVLQSFVSNNDFSDDEENEENDPVVHSFGPFGDNLLPRMQSFTTGSTSQAAPRRRSAPLSPQHSSSQESKVPRFNASPVKNHVINQLAFSRVHSLPLSAIHNNLPADLKTGEDGSQSSSGSQSSTRGLQLTKQELKELMDDIPCVGEIPRSGKDAAGKPLENEFYYVPEMDTNMARRETVTFGMRGSGLRSVRKQHKVRLPFFCSLRLSFVSSCLHLRLLAILLEASSRLSSFCLRSCSPFRVTRTLSLDART